MIHTNYTLEYDPCKLWNDQGTNHTIMVLMPLHLQFTTMPGKILASPVRELLAVAQVEPLDVVAVLRERRQRRVTHRL